MSMPWSNQGLQVQRVPRGVHHGHPEVCIEGLSLWGLLAVEDSP